MQHGFLSVWLQSVEQGWPGAVKPIYAHARRRSAPAEDWLWGSRPAQLIDLNIAGLAWLDPVAFGSAIILFAVSGFAACALPVKRAQQIALIEALREE